MPIRCPSLTEEGAGKAGRRLRPQSNPNQLEIAQEFRFQAQRIFGLFRAGAARIRARNRSCYVPGGVRLLKPQIAAGVDRKDGPKKSLD
jgi:hypothetical protein